MKYNTILLFLIIASLVGCQADELSNNSFSIEDQQTINKQLKKFEESVVMIPLVNQDLSSSVYQSVSEEVSPIRIKLENFDKNYKPKSAFKLNGVAFSDDGKYNDLIAGDGIYTSVKKGRLKMDSNSSPAFASENFAYDEGMTTQGLKVTCELTHDDCPEDGGFWDSDWGTGWGCFYLDNCTIEFEIDF